MPEAIKALILYSPVPRSETEYLDFDKTPFSADPKRIQNLKDRVENDDWLIIIISGGQVRESNQISIGFALEKIDAGKAMTIEIFVKDEPDPHASIRELASRLEHDPRVSWQRFTDDDDLETRLLVLGEVGRQALIKVFRARSVFLNEAKLFEESANLRIKVIRLMADDPVSNEKWQDYRFLYFRLCNLKEYGSAKDAAVNLLEIARFFEDEKYVGWAYLEIGYCLHQLGELKAAEQAILQSVDFAKKAGEESVLGGRYRRLGMIYRSASRLEAAEKCFMDALVIETKLGDKANAAATCELLSSLNRFSGA